MEVVNEEKIGKSPSRRIFQTFCSREKPRALASHDIVTTARTNSALRFTQVTLEMTARENTRSRSLSRGERYVELFRYCLDFLIPLHDFNLSIVSATSVVG
jgi:hypothetical protein